ncbi:hypothetical protein RND81_08G027200 [Saponaria officinalis]|uniref:Uncharacterized protein n=1 Tax=Saponaria officinalis TaxID=3572 RepID=A0AAW1J3H3_SAPOF
MVKILSFERNYSSHMVRSLEKEGIPSKQAEAITSAITGVLNGMLENVSYSFVSKGEMQKTELIQDGNISKFKTEVQSSQEKPSNVYKSRNKIF